MEIADWLRMQGFVEIVLGLLMAFGAFTPIVAASGSVLRNTEALPTRGGVQALVQAHELSRGRNSRPFQCRGKLQRAGRSQWVKPQQPERLIPQTVTGLNLVPRIPKCGQYRLGYYFVLRAEDPVPAKPRESRSTLRRRAPPNDQSGIVVEKGAGSFGLRLVKAQRDEGGRVRAMAHFHI